MEFNEKLQELRKQKGLTQQEVADSLYVSRTAISKWESGRGYPNIDSLKNISELFSVTIDELLSGDEILTIAEENTKQKENHIRDLCFGLLDICALMLLFLPFFAHKADGVIRGVSLLSLTAISSYLKIVYLVVVIAIILMGVLTIVLQNCEQNFWVRGKSKISLFINILATVLFIISQQPYAATFIFIFLLIKVLLLIKSSDT